MDKAELGGLMPGSGPAPHFHVSRVRAGGSLGELKAAMLLLMQVSICLPFSRAFRDAQRWGINSIVLPDLGSKVGKKVGTLLPLWESG